MTARGVRRDLNGTWIKAARSLLLSLILMGGFSSASALARGVIIEIAPPPDRVEVVPVQRRGYTWAPGYWRWQRGQHVWVGGHTMRARTGYAWTPDRWNDVGKRHEFKAGHWTRGSEGREQ
ncbi:MAG TPA: YXWGXW repeat-containing protein [Gemmatimonadaceae bacterium]|nr:YXWGXW repeat-containing protein [Gemmatimonadaceae bacterium]